MRRAAGQRGAQELSSTSDSDDEGEEHDNAASRGEKGKGEKGKGEKGKANTAQAGKRKGRSETEGHEPPADPPAKKRCKSRQSVVIDSDEDATKKSRYKPVSTSSLHTSWDSSILDLIRKEFQLAVMARDGFPAKVSSLDRTKNLMQLIASAKKVLEQKMYAKFKGQVDAAYQDTTKE